MNYLAHLYLAGDDDDLLVGALLGDFVKGRLENLPLSPPLRAGVRLHRQIDVFTDSHELVTRSKQRISPERRRYAGLIVDLAYDHFLAKHWRSFATRPLDSFTADMYRLLLARRSEMPERLQHVLPRMAAQDWLGSYSELENVAYALERIGGRLRRGNPLVGTLDELERGYIGLEADFLAFFPRLDDYARLQRQIPPP